MYLNYKKFILSFTGAAVFFFLSAYFYRCALECGDDNSDFSNYTLRFARVAFTDAADVIKRSEALCEYLRKETGVYEVKLIIAPDYHGILNFFAENEADLGWPGCVSYVEGAEKYGIVPIVKPVRQGTATYSGLIIARADSGIDTLTDLKGKKMAWVDRESASGYLFPAALLAKSGINIEKDLGETIFLQKHDAVVLNVLLKKVDAGACYDDARDVLKDKTKAGKIKVIAKTPAIANEPIVCRAGLPAGLVAKVKAAFLKLDPAQPGHARALDADINKIERFVEAKDGDYDNIREALKSASVK